jgi:hypothetical protein
MGEQSAEREDEQQRQEDHVTTGRGEDDRRYDESNKGKAHRFLFLFERRSQARGDWGTSPCYPARAA